MVHAQQRRVWLYFGISEDLVRGAGFAPQFLAGDGRALSQRLQLHPAHRRMYRVAMYCGGDLGEGTCQEYRGDYDQQGPACHDLTEEQIVFDFSDRASIPQN